MKYMALLFLLFAWQGPAPKQAATDSVQQDTHADQTKPQSSTPVTERATPDDHKNNGTQQTTQDNEQAVRIVPTSKIATESKKDFWDRALVAATWVLVFIGAGQIIFLWRTVDATWANAKAARASAEALINSERAWMVGMRTENKLNLAPQRNENLVYFCKVTNVGRTPSRILEVGIAFRRIDSLDKIPPEPAYQATEIIKFNEITVVPNDYIPVASSLFPQISEGEFPTFRNRKLFFYGYGYVKYLDLFSRNVTDVRESRFCHYYFISGPDEPSAEGFMPCIKAPSEYHRATQKDNEKNDQPN